MENVTVFRKSSPIQASAKVVIKDFVEVIQTSKPGEKFDSDVFMVGDTKMLIRVYPNGRQEDKEKKSDDMIPLTISAESLTAALEAVSSSGAPLVGATVQLKLRGQGFESVTQVQIDKELLAQLRKGENINISISRTQLSQDKIRYVEVYLVNESDRDVTVKYKFVTEVSTVTGNREVKSNGDLVDAMGWVLSHVKCADAYKDKDFILTAFVEIPGKNMKIWGSESADISEKYCIGKKLYEKMQDTNFSLVFTGTEVFCHKQVLAAASPVFEAMVGNEYLEAKESKANIVGISEEVGRAFVKFIYTGELEDEVLKEYAVAFLELGDMYDIQELKDLSEGELLIQLDKKNMLEFLSIGDDSNAKRLFEAALSMTKANISWLRSQVSIEQKSISSITKM